MIQFELERDKMNKQNAKLKEDISKMKIEICQAEDKLYQQKQVTLTYL